MSENRVDILGDMKVDGDMNPMQKNCLIVKSEERIECKST